MRTKKAYSETGETTSLDKSQELAVIYNPRSIMRVIIIFVMVIMAVSYIGVVVLQQVNTETTQEKVQSSELMLEVGQLCQSTGFNSQKCAKGIEKYMDSIESTTEIIKYGQEALTQLGIYLGIPGAILMLIFRFI